MTIVEMYVHMDCSGCEKKIRKSLKNLKGIHQIDIDREKQKVTVMGFADQRKIINAVKKTGKVVEPWPFQLNDPEYIFDQYYNGNGRIDSYNNYPSHGLRHYFSSIPNDDNYSGSDHYNNSYHRRNEYTKHGHIGYFHQPAYSELVKDRPGAYFSDDNAVGCSIM